MSPPTPAGPLVATEHASPRSRRLETWLTRQVDLRFQEITLPVSGRRYTIARPDQVSKDRLFAEARAHPDRQMPHWADIWASGVALADVAIERAAEVADHPVLELGAGLGTTASALLDVGASVTAADYSLLSLAHCRYNTLMNTGRAPRVLRFNWRSPRETSRSRAKGIGPFRLILGADVLYEFRDVDPLFDLIEQLLTPDGVLWLAEPERKTAVRFLDAVKARAWEIDSYSVSGPWPDGADGRVNIHCLRRAGAPR